MASKEARKVATSETDLPNPLKEDDMIGPIPTRFNLLNDHAARYTPKKASRAVEGKR
ncbi:MAG: hypothetical protein V1875_02365 [Candidatus Altiarchaeota archaeon]